MYDERSPRNNFSVIYSVKLQNAVIESLLNKGFGR